MSELKQLKQSAENKSVYQKLISGEMAGFDILDKFESPMAESRQKNLTLDIEIPEFTSLCPITGQPDFATIKISYQPNRFCVESKSLKLYVLSFREKGMFHEQCVTLILEDLVKLLEPKYLKVVGEFTPRGGIPFWPTATYFE